MITQNEINIEGWLHITMRPVIHELSSSNLFFELLHKNPGWIVMKWGAKWCAPCKRIDPVVYQWFDKMPDTVQCMMLDVDLSSETYLFLKSKKMVPAVPTLLAYRKPELGQPVTFAPDLIVVGANPEEIKQFFKSVLASSFAQKM